jgi:HEAT repeat protein
MNRCCAALLLLFAVCAAPSAAQSAGSQDAGERRRAARALARQGSDAIPRLVPLLSDADLQVRIEAVKGIIEIGTPASLDPLVAATRDNDPEIQIRATDGLVNFYLPGYLRTGLSSTLRRAGSKITTRFTSGEDQIVDTFVDVRLNVIEALGRLTRGGSSMESRANAARALGVLRGKAGIPDLLEAVRSKDSQIMYECLVALRKIGDRSAGPRITSLVRDLDKKVRIAAIEAAGVLRNAEAIPDLQEVLKTNKDRDVLRSALTSVAMIANPGTRAYLAQYLRDKDAGMRGAAAEGLGRLGNAEDLPALEKAFEDERDHSARLSLAFALVMLGKREASQLSPLQYLVDNLNSAARAGEAQPLLTEAARIDAVRAALRRTVQAGTRDEKKGLAWVLAYSGGTEDAPLLEALARDSDVAVAGEAVRALRTLRARLP